jgi:hypothetical protein
MSFTVGGSGRDDVWAVPWPSPFQQGTAPPPAGYAWHWNGTAWQQVTVPTLDSYGVVRKVVSSSPNDAWILYESGLVAHWDRMTWAPSATGPRVGDLFWDGTQVWATAGALGVIRHP